MCENDFVKQLNEREGLLVQQIGFIGLGNMGGRVCKAIAKKYPVNAFDINPDTAEKLKDCLNLLPSTLDVLKCSDVIFLSLPSTKIVEPIILEFLQNGVAGNVIVDTSTSYPVATRRLAKQVEAAGGSLVDLPLSGVPANADEGKLLALFGGDPAMFEALRPIVSCFANRYANLGGSGCGHTAKLIFNYVALSYVSIYATAFPLTEKMGLDNQQLFELLQTTGMHCGTMDFYVPKMIHRTYDMAFALGLAHKDLTYVKDMFEEYQVPAFPLDGTLTLLRTAIRDGKANDDYSACISTMFEFFENK